MTPPPFVLPYALFFWPIYLGTFWPEFRIIQRARKAQTSADQKSLQVILAGGSIALLVAFPLAWIKPFQFSPSSRVPLFWLGLTALLLGGLLRRHCWRMLGSSFTGDVRASNEQVVVTRGAYAFLRHPSYSAALLMNTGIGITLGSWASALLIAVASFAVYSYRIAVEERALLAAIGEPYREFMRTRKRLIPFLY